jgi:hypothetical protein
MAESPSTTSFADLASPAVSHLVIVAGGKGSRAAGRDARSKFTPDYIAQDLAAATGIILQYEQIAAS